MRSHARAKASTVNFSYVFWMLRGKERRWQWPRSQSVRERRDSEAQAGSPIMLPLCYGNLNMIILVLPCQQSGSTTTTHMHNLKAEKNAATRRWRSRKKSSTKCEAPWKTRNHNKKRELYPRSNWISLDDFRSLSLSLFPSFARFFNWKLSDASGSSVNEEMMGVWRKYLMHLEHCIYPMICENIGGREGDGWMRLSSWNDLQLIANLTQARLGSPPTDMRELDVTRRRTKNECGKLIFSGKKEREMSSMPNDIYSSYMESVRSCSFRLYTSPARHFFKSHFVWHVDMIRGSH